MKQNLSAVLFTILRQSCQKYWIFICFFCLFFPAINLPGQAPPIQWQKGLGGSGVEWPDFFQMTADGSYIAAGTTDSNDGDVSGWHGGSDIWVVKLSQTGVIQWQRCLGGSGDEVVVSIQQTTDGGYIVFGTTTSTDGDVSGWHAGYDIIDGNPLPDYWVVKLDNGGAIQWQKCLGGSGGEYIFFYHHPNHPIQQTTDGGYIIIGTTRSNNGDVFGWHPGYDFNGPVTDCWVVKLNNVGAIQWQTCLGGSGMDGGNSIYQTPDGGYILAGSVTSNNGDASGNHGSSDGWIVKLNSAGAIQWQKCLGGSSGEDAYFIQLTLDGGYIIAGYTSSNNGDVSGWHGTTDIWLVKLSGTGIIQWQKCLGGSSYDEVRSIQETTDGGSIIAGHTASNNGDISGFHGLYDIWLVKLSPSGVIQWQKCLGGTADDDVQWIQKTPDGGYIFAGSAASNDGDVSGWHP